MTTTPAAAVAGTDDAQHGDHGSYGEWLTATAGLSVTTMRTYTGHVRDYTRWWTQARPDQPLAAAAPGDVEAYLGHLAGRGLRASTRRTALHALRSYYRWLHHSPDPHGAESRSRDADSAVAARRNPAAAVRRPRVSAARTVVYSEAEAARVLQAAYRRAALDEATGSDRLRAAVDHAVLATLRWTGVRASELCGLTVGDVDLTQRLLHVHGKGSKHRLVPLPAEAVAVLTGYLTDQRSALGQDTSASHLFVNPHSPTLRLTARALLEICRRHGDAANVQGRHTAVRWRHTYATLTLARGVDLHTLARLLGHASVATTERYLHLDTGALTGAITRAYPPPNP